MQAYLVTDHLVTTQAKSKAEGVWPAISVVIRTPKEEAIEDINALIVRCAPHVLGTVQSDDVPPTPDMEDAPVATPVITDDNCCAICRRSKSASKIMQNSYALTDLETAIWDIEEEHYLDKVLDAINTRRREIQEKAA